VNTNNKKTSVLANAGFLEKRKDREYKD